ncbi:AMP-binding protein, partial [Chitinophaga sp. GbtcB8]|uniref:AMP-binding protein n=1 Tax=Chitinophaga sp. GbtcB8 TaxID=2824753 RepID=UPI001C2F9C03
ISAGESCDQRLADSWAAYHDFYNKYGPTEATISATIYHYKKDNTGPVLPIGKPVANTRLYVLDERQQLLPIGISGELYIGGVGVSRGYLGKDALT